MHENDYKNQYIANDMRENDDFYYKKRRFVIKWFDEYLFVESKTKVDKKKFTMYNVLQNKNTFVDPRRYDKRTSASFSV